MQQGCDGQLNKVGRVHFLRYSVFERIDRTAIQKADLPLTPPHNRLHLFCCPAAACYIYSVNSRTRTTKLQHLTPQALIQSPGNYFHDCLFVQETGVLLPQTQFNDDHHTALQNKIQTKQCWRSFVGAPGEEFPRLSITLFAQRFDFTGLRVRRCPV
eukprot:1195022-Prorocentrum_minimum.AAC.5